jgi:hypothetical protein
MVKNRNECSVWMGKHEENRPLRRTKNKFGITRNRTLSIQNEKLQNALIWFMISISGGLFLNVVTSLKGYVKCNSFLHYLSKYCGIS